MDFKDFDVLKIGNSLEIKGVIYGNAEEDIIVMLPSHGLSDMVEILEPTLEEWNSIIRQSDLLETEVVSGDLGGKKIILRKSTRQIDLNVSWAVFRRDGYKCQYCGNDHIPLTVDHIVLWEEGGPTIEDNLITACKKCNNTRGNMSYEEWLISPQYAKVSEHLNEVEKLRNEIYANRIPRIKANHMRVNKRNR